MSSLEELNVFPLMQDLEFFFPTSIMLVGCVCFAACVFLLGLFFFRGCFCFHVFVLVGLGWGCFLSGFFFRVFVLGWVGLGWGWVG